MSRRRTAQAKNKTRHEATTAGYQANTGERLPGGTAGIRASRLMHKPENEHEHSNEDIAGDEHTEKWSSEWMDMDDDSHDESVDSTSSEKTNA